MKKRDTGVNTLGFKEVSRSDKRLKSGLDTIINIFSDVKQKELDFREVDSHYDFYSAFSVKNAGACMDLAKKCLFQKGTIDNDIFYEFYNKNTNRNRVGSAFMKALKVAELHFKDSTKEFVKESLVSYFYKRIISDTVKGFNKEVEVAKLIKSTQGIDVTHSSSEIDNKYSVDLETVEFAVQVKPETYKSNSSNNPKLLKDKQTNLRLHKEYKDKFGKDVLFAYYSKKSVAIDLSEIKTYMLNKR